MTINIAGYTYKAENLCAECTITALCGDESLNIGWEYDADNVIRFAALVKGINMDDESSYDSDDFPKVIFRPEDEPQFIAFHRHETEDCAHCHTTLWRKPSSDEPIFPEYLDKPNLEDRLTQLLGDDD